MIEFKVSKKDSLDNLGRIRTVEIGPYSFSIEDEMSLEQLGEAFIVVGNYIVKEEKKKNER